MIIPSISCLLLSQVIGVERIKDLKHLKIIMCQVMEASIKHLTKIMEEILSWMAHTKIIYKAINQIHLLIVWKFHLIAMIKDSSNTSWQVALWTKMTLNIEITTKKIKHNVVAIITRIWCWIQILLMGLEIQGLVLQWRNFHIINIKVIALGIQKTWKSKCITIAL